ncbi:unnamed protein product [Debaryomyces fabryi]|nr:unnamed protein product [Debaryomyces fabryi]
MSLQPNIDHATITSRLNGHHQNANTISHLSQETPLPFKKYTKKRSWVWDWFEQDPDNKYRAVCLYCHQEIFRLDGDRGSPKKLITHVNSKHGINKDNFAGEGLFKIRLEKLKTYVNTFGPLVTNRGDAIVYGIMNLGIQNMTAVPNTSPIISGPSAASVSPPQQNSIPSEPIGVIVGETRPQLPVITKSTNHDIQPQAFPTPPSTETTNVPRAESREPPMYLNVIDPSLSSSFYERQTDLNSNSVFHKSKKQEEIEKYNNLIVNHNRQVEEYNKAAVIENDRNMPSEGSSSGSELHRTLENYKFKPQKLFIPLETDHEALEGNKCKDALREFIINNSASFNNVLFIESESFKQFVNILREHPNDPI